ncbi:MAG: hypothetical protein Q9222_001294 [Ikaeria aurantiellina]
MSTALSQPSHSQGRSKASTRNQSGTLPKKSKPSQTRDAPKEPLRIAAIPPPGPSKPVIIPTRTRLDHLSTRAQAVPHDPHALPPSVAAFLAIANPPDPGDVRLSPSLPKGPDKYAGHGLDETAKIDYHGVASSESSPHSWRLLLSPPQEGEEEDSGVGSNNAGRGPPSSLRSLSSESMPSLDTDTESTQTSSSPLTPTLPLIGYGYRERRSKSVSSSVPEGCETDHPLLLKPLECERVGGAYSDDIETDEVTLRHTSRPSLRSNLTASLRRLKSAARSLSTVAGPTPIHDVPPTKASLAGPSCFTDERRPLPWVELPDPALRRYLNPITVSPTELYNHRDSLESSGSCTASIQMQTYRPGARKSEKASAPPVFVNAASQSVLDEESTMSAACRHREPRENSDFLRVIVLEMNMRKVGKLCDSEPGRARLWLPARQMSSQSAGRNSETPKRWMSISV